MDYTDRAQILKKSLIFSSLNEDELVELSRLAVERSFMSGEYVFWEGDAPDWFYVVMFVFLSVVSVFLLNFRRLTITATSQSLTVAFGMVKRTIPWGEIEQFSRDESSSFAYGGWGIRISKVGRKWRLVYNIAGYPGIVLSLRTGRFREFVFSTSNPEQVLGIINQHTGTAGEQGHRLR